MWRSRQGAIVFSCLVLAALGLGLFAKGFFLTRVELKNASECPRSTGDVGICNFPKRFDRAVIVIIDALRLDFVHPEALQKLHSSDMSSSSGLYLNKLTTLRNLLGERPENTFLAQLDADPPTTTMQRLKGITTGGLPTFIDIKDDVASERIHEDNLLAQLQKQGKRVTFMGDDTWSKLFPEEMTKQFPYESFNVKDLDTLDNGVISHLFPELKKNDWDVLVAHFLGVDHAGHRYGPRHSEMTRKLIEMDDMLDALIKHMDEIEGGGETILLVFGDHGMTESGDHGGSTEEERSSALFAYSPRKPLFKQFDRENDPLQMVQQIDLAPTLAFLLDIPVPFGSLGFLVPELVGSDWRSLLKAAKQNANQILNYLIAYSSQVEGSLPLESLLKMQTEVDKVIVDDDSVLRTEEELREAFEKLRTIARKAAEDARGLWTQFNLPLMAFGVFLCVAAIVGLLFQMVEVRLLRDVPYGLVLAWLTGVLALPSNSYIATEMNIALFALLTMMVVDINRSQQNQQGRWHFLVKSTLAAMVIRASWGLESFIRTTGHEVPSGYGWIFHGAIPLLSVLLALWWRLNSTQLSVATREINSTSSINSTQLAISKLNSTQYSALLITLQATLGVAFWAMSLQKLHANALAQGAYIAVVPCVATTTDFVTSLLCMFVPLGLILGPAGPLALVGFLIVSLFLAVEVYADARPFWKGVAIGLTSVLWFFYTGHSCVFGTLRITSPYVGFEEFGYWRGVVMLTMDTFAAHLMGCAMALWLGGEHALVGFAAVFASRAAMMMCFVYFARRHLMVWAIFAPKFIFDASAYAACLAFSAMFVALYRWQLERRSRSLNSGSTKGKDA